MTPEGQIKTKKAYRESDKPFCNIFINLTIYIGVTSHD